MEEIKIKIAKLMKEKKNHHNDREKFKFKGKEEANFKEEQQKWRIK